MIQHFSPFIESIYKTDNANIFLFICDIESFKWKMSWNKDSKVMLVGKMPIDIDQKQQKTDIYDNTDFWCIVDEDINKNRMRVFSINDLLEEMLK